MGLQTGDIAKLTEAAANGVKIDVNVTDDTLKTTGTYLIAAAAIAGVVIAVSQFILKKVFGSE